MPVLVIGADHPVGRSIIAALHTRAGEIRAFISDPSDAAALKARSIKVAVGDLSDGSHVGSAGLDCFTLVFVTAVAHDSREQSFAKNADELFTQWQEAIDMSGARRVIWVEDELSAGSGKRIGAPEVAVVTTVGRSLDSAADEVAELDEIAELPPRAV